MNKNKFRETWKIEFIYYLWKMNKTKFLLDVTKRNILNQEIIKKINRKNTINKINEIIVEENDKIKINDNEKKDNKKNKK